MTEQGPLRRLVWLIAGMAAALSAPAHAETQVFTAARMIDVAAGKVVEHPAIFVTDGRITSVADARLVRWGSDVKHIDLGDRTILPGLIDMHVHLDGLAEIGGYRGLQYTDSFWAMIAVRNARDMLHAGFTTVRNLGSENYNDVGLMQAIDEGCAEGPRIVPAAHALGATGGHCDSTFLPPSFEAKSPGVGDGEQQLRQRVREQRKYGAQVIKVCATGGVFSRNTEPGQQQLSEQELRAIVEEAHLWGLRVAAHAHGAAGIKAAIRAGIDTIEHVSLLDDEGIRLALKRERPVWFSMDIFNTDYTQASGRENGVLEENLRKDREIAQIQRDNFRKAQQAGVRMIFGSDAGVMPHGTAGGQFRYMVAYGMTPLQAIQAATITAAQALGKEEEVGQIAAGRHADLIAVDGDPLLDVRLLEHVSVVIKGGQVVKDGTAVR
ncbi:metal-dependent hydrolase family protein [Sphingobium lignivorans]|uniref:Imidazolonepropionase-like amidohydrolase n=1 Tax=Sphingobium lignivorans TaxID=2735886 RepID=A0ABR6NN89_9SPHN|nr:amidohydrolase family protein [Sphingobium lignivorans]MBB5987669.1 imidazolonepropionase-like amidohydrolase [Sphingobium lignivorans]